MGLLGDPGGRWGGPHSGIRVSKEEGGETGLGTVRHEMQVNERKIQSCAEAPDLEERLGFLLYSRPLLSGTIGK